jgi:F420H(2)-dependent quinone reductase
VPSASDRTEAQVIRRDVVHRLLDRKVEPALGRWTVHDVLGSRSVSRELAAPAIAVQTGEACRMRTLAPLLAAATIVTIARTAGAGEPGIASTLEGDPMASKRQPFLPPRWFIRGAWIVHRALVSLSGGRIGLGKPSKSYGTLRLHTTGRRSGARRMALLGYFEDGPNLFTLAMNGWGEPEPAWWLNLQANPDATIELADETRPIRARAATGNERDRLWAVFEQHSASLGAYAARRPRETAVVVFEPRGSTSVAARS